MLDVGSRNIGRSLEATREMAQGDTKYYYETFSTMKTKRFPLYILMFEQIISILWVYIVLLYLGYLFITANFLDYTFMTYSFSIFLLSSFTMTFINVIQFTVALFIDSRYEKRIWLDSYL